MAPLPCFRICANSYFRAQPDARQIDRQHPVPVVQRVFVRRRIGALRHAGVVVGAIQPPVGRHGLADQRRHLRVGRHVGTHEHRLTALLRDAVHRLLAAVLVHVPRQPAALPRGQTPAPLPGQSPNCRPSPMPPCLPLVPPLPSAPPNRVMPAFGPFSNNRRVSYHTPFSVKVHCRDSMSRFLILALFKK